MADMPRKENERQRRMGRGVRLMEREEKPESWREVGVKEVWWMRRREKDW